ncbi:MAG: putative RNA-binding protein, contains TRAM domain protein [uncultured archaeon A07HR60]|nr:MAG: putative RNA-binding protein, contains TRAM domain protein [uncultured archaeon A07HR60]
MWVCSRNRRSIPASSGGTHITVDEVCQLGGYLDLKISDDLLCLFSAEIQETEDGYTIEVPRREVETGSIEPDGVHQVALISNRSEDEAPSTSAVRSDEPQPPVEPGEMRYVEVEDLGKQGDGIARVERGYVIIVPGSDVGERVKIEITDVKSNFAVGNVVEEGV